MKKMEKRNYFNQKKFNIKKERRSKLKVKKKNMNYFLNNYQIFNKNYKAISIIILIYLININVFVINSLESNFIRIIYLGDSYIDLKINSTGYANVYYSDIRNTLKPDEIYINGIFQNNIDYKYYLNKTENNIKLLWKTNITSTQCMFCGCSQINEINLCLII